MDEIELLDDSTIIVSGHKTGFTGTEAGIYKSTDKGYSWSLVNAFDIAGQHVSKMAWVDSQTAYVGTKSTFDNGVLLKTTDQGENLFWVSGLTGIEGIEYVDFYNESTGMVITNDGRTLYTLNNGATWNTTLTTSLSTPVLVKYLSQQIVYTVNINQSQTSITVYKSTDAGASWSMVFYENGTNLEIIGFDVKNKAYFSFLSNDLLNIRTSIDGENWSIIPTNQNVSDINSMHLYDVSNLYFTGYDYAKDSSVVYNIDNLGITETNYIEQDTTVQKIQMNSSKQGIAIGDYGKIFIYDQINSSHSVVKNQFNVLYSDHRISWENERQVKIEIYTISGQLVKEELLTGTEYNISDLTPSIYLARIVDLRSGISSSSKFLVH